MGARPARISLVTRSGENRFHGVAYDYFRNDARDANEFFDNAVTGRQNVQKNDRLNRSPNKR